MAAGNVDMKKNNNLYKQNQAQLDQITNVNMVDQIKKDQPKLQAQRIKEEEKSVDIEATLKE